MMHAQTSPRTGKRRTHQHASDAERRAALRALRTPGAFLLLPEASDTGGVFMARASAPMMKLSRSAIQEMCDGGALRLVTATPLSRRYVAVSKGRSAGPRTASDRKNAKWLEAEKLFADPAGGAPRAIRVSLGESPLGWLSKRRNSQGDPFLSQREVDAGERLRAEFERAQLGPSVTMNWHRFLTSGTEGGGAAGPTLPESATAARKSVLEAMDALGPGLSDIAFRSCCFLEGLEAVESDMQWSARSGKVVLKIALQRLASYYENLHGGANGHAGGRIKSWHASPSETLAP